MKTRRSFFQSLLATTTMVLVDLGWGRRVQAGIVGGGNLPAAEIVEKSNSVLAAALSQIGVIKKNLEYSHLDLYKDRYAHELEEGKITDKELEDIHNAEQGEQTFVPAISYWGGNDKDHRNAIKEWSYRTSLADQESYRIRNAFFARSRK